MQYFTQLGVPPCLTRDGWWLTPPANNPTTTPKDRALSRVSLFKGYRNTAVARNLAARNAAPAKGQ